MNSFVFATPYLELSWNFVTTVQETSQLPQNRQIRSEEIPGYAEKFSAIKCFYRGEVIKKRGERKKQHELIARSLEENTCKTPTCTRAA